jgi:hypothetical protein
MTRTALTAGPWVLLVAGAVDLAAGFGLLTGGTRLDLALGGGEVTFALVLLWFLARAAEKD